MLYSLFEYYGSNVLLFRRNGYRQSGSRIPWVRNKDTTCCYMRVYSFMPDPPHILHAWICNLPGPSEWCWSCTHHAWCDPESLLRGDSHHLPVNHTSHCNHTESKRWLTTSCVSYGGAPVYHAVLMQLVSTVTIHRWSAEPLYGAWLQCFDSTYYITIISVRSLKLSMILAIDFETPFST